MKKLLLIWTMICIFNNVSAVVLPTVSMPHHSLIKYIEVYAHRGDRSYAPENVIPGYKTALAVGTLWIDIDIGVTKDGVIIVDHDLWLNPDILSKHGKFWAKSKADFIKSIPVSQFDEKIQPYLVKNLTLKQLQQYEAGIINPQSQYAHDFPDQHSIPGTHIPTLQQVVNYVNKVTHNKARFQIEIKNDPHHPDWTVPVPKFVALLDKFIKQNHLAHRVEVQAFDFHALILLHKLDPQIHTSFLLSAGEIKALRSSHPESATIWTDNQLLSNYNNSLPQMVKALGGTCYEPEDVALTYADLIEARNLDLKVVTWSVPEHGNSAFNPQLIDKLIQWGVDGIITDDPGRLISMLAARGYRVPPRYIVN